MAEGITTAAEQLVTVLERLPDINRMYAFPHPNMEFRDACLQYMGSLPAETFVPAQFAMWEIFVMLPSKTSTGRPADLEAILNRLGSDDSEQSISGILKTQQVDASLRMYGSPRVVEGPIITRGKQSQNGPVVTWLRATIGAYVKNT